MDVRDLFSALDDAIYKYERLNALLNILHNQVSEGSIFSMEVYDNALFELWLMNDENYKNLQKLYDELFSEVIKND